MPAQAFELFTKSLNLHSKRIHNTIDLTWPFVVCAHGTSKRLRKVSKIEFSQLFLFGRQDLGFLNECVNSR